MIKKKIISIITIILISFFSVIPGFDSEAITPRVMLSDYKISSNEIYPGDTFSVTFKLKNTSKNYIMNLKCSVSSEKGVFIPAEGTGTFYVKEIEGEAETEITVKLKAMNKLEEKTYKLDIKSEYEDWSSKYKVTDSIYIPIKLKTEVFISETYIAEEEIRLGDNIEIVSRINNVGGADIYKVKATAMGDNISDATVYVGNVASGKSGNIDIITKATAVSKPDTGDNKIIITCEDIEGNEYTVEELLGNNGKIEVLEQDYSDIIKIKEDTSRHMTGMDKLIIVIAVVVILVIILIIRRVLKRKRLERDFD